LLRWITARFEEEVQGGKEIAATLQLATEERRNQRVVAAIKEEMERSERGEGI
jgi:hypothetical protein